MRRTGAATTSSRYRNPAIRPGFFSAHVPSLVTGRHCRLCRVKHYSDRHWFLATPVAEIGKYNLQTCQDYVDLAAMIERGEMVAVPAVTDTYVLFGVGVKVDESVFSRYENDHRIELYDEAQLSEAYN